jgi:hypothetical protein
MNGRRRKLRGCKIGKRLALSRNLTDKNPIQSSSRVYIHLRCRRNLSDQTRTRRSKCPQEKRTKRHRTTSLSSAASSYVPPSAETAEGAPEPTAAAADASATTSPARYAGSLLRTLAPIDSPMSLVRLSLWFLLSFIV